MKIKIENQKIGFTLAEVLITLSIVGVVAALTIPTLISHYNKKITEVRLKKFYSVMNQAIERLKTEYGDLNSWGYDIDNVLSDDIGAAGMDRLVDQSDDIVKNFKKFFGKVINFTYEEDVNVEGHNLKLFYFVDGSAIMPKWYNSFDYEFFPKNAKKCLTYPHTKRYGTCSFAFQFYSNKKDSNSSFMPYRTDSDGFSKKQLYEDSSKGCSNGIHASGNYCGLIIMQNGWTVPKDYPRKLSY